MKINLQNKISLVTGAGRGIGEAICLDLAKAGSKIIAIFFHSELVNTN